MGGHISNQSGVVNDKEVNKDSFKYIDLIANGAYHNVWKVRLKINNKNYILKQMIKSKLGDNKTLIALAVNERRFLARMNHPFIVNMHFAFQDEESLFLVYDCLSEEDLTYYLEKQKIFNENQIKFFASCALLALEYCLSYKIMHCNVTPDSFRFTSYGYIKLNDFSLAKIYQSSSSKTNTDCINAFGLEYTSPEVICGLSPIPSSDLFSIGVISYEMMNGRKPYEGESLVEIRNQMMIKEINAKQHSLWSTECVDFINRLLKRKPQLRLGYNNYSEVKNHSWLVDVNWDKLYNQEILSPFISKRNFTAIGDNATKKTKNLVNITKQRKCKTKNFRNPYSEFYNFNRFVMDREDKVLGYTKLYNNFHKKLYEKQSKANGKEEKGEVNSISRNSIQ